ncbi:MAG: hypothetical protein MK012_06300 [Dehalococcoidia bacterium]|jgi:hypothetical protein|nr:hypothetical protein [Dehalococcoidia bacterium]|tara:strand:+ start:3260 stop:3712 length:453 start_codon:yes stop_codon:yes gene_type:complete
MGESLFIEPIKKFVSNMQEKLSALINKPDSNKLEEQLESPTDAIPENDITIENDIIPQIPATIPEIDDDLLEIDTVDNNFLLEEENEEDQENTESDLNLVDDDNNLRDLFTTNVKTDPIVLQLLEKHGTLTAEELAKELNEFMQFIKDRD